MTHHLACSECDVLVETDVDLQDAPFVCPLCVDVLPRVDRIEIRVLQHTTETIAGLRMLADNGGALAPAFIISIAERAIADYAQLQQRCEEMASALRMLADYPLEEFGKECKDDYYPLFGANNWELNVGHVRAARKALGDAP